MSTNDKTDWGHALVPAAIGLGFMFFFLGIGGCCYLVSAGEARKEMSATPLPEHKQQKNQ